MNRWLRAVLGAGLVALAVLLALGLRHDPSEIPSPLLGTPWPALTGTDLQGAPATLAATGERPMLVNVWASWCVPCATEHPVLMQLAEEYGSRVRMAGIAYRDSREASETWLRQRGNPYQQLLLDPSGRAGIEVGVYGVPETYLVDTRGRIVHKYVGELRADVVRARLNALLASDEAAS